MSVKKKLGLHPTPDASHWRKFWSTKLAALSAGCVAAALFWAQAPAEWKEAFPAWVGTALMYGGLASALLIPFATTTQQKNITKGE